VDFVLRRALEAGAANIALEVKVHPLLTDHQKLQRITAAYPLQAVHLVGRFPTPGFTNFIWGGFIF
jgi:hypothetical protein